MNSSTRAARAFSLYCRVLLPLFAGALGMVSVRAQEPNPPRPPLEIGPAAKAWIDLQDSNREAGPSLPMLGDAATNAYRRYIDSFKLPIPAQFSSSLTSSGSGSNGTSASQ